MFSQPSINSHVHFPERGDTTERQLWPSMTEKVVLIKANSFTLSEIYRRSESLAFFFPGSIERRHVITLSHGDGGE